MVVVSQENGVTFYDLRSAIYDCNVSSSQLWKMKNSESKNWPRGEFAWHEVIQFWWWLLIPVIGLIAASLFYVIWQLQKPSAAVVVVYCAQDQTYAEPILQDFQDETGIRVKAVYDSEAVKTVGLANRLLAERDHPQCDVFWGNEEMRTRQLAAFDVWREPNGFVSFGARMRCLVVNTNRVGLDQLPASLLGLTNATWRGKVAIAFPQFGTTATHFHVLRQHWGDELWQQWCRGLVANDARILDGNSTVVKLVGRGEVWIGLTDTDDVAAGRRDDLPVARGPELTETLLFIPNTVGITRGAPHPEKAQRLADYLRRPGTVERLLQAGAIQYAEIPAMGRPTLQPDWDRLLRDLDATTELLNGMFLK
jgi:iron(III) transport system substrate-binding protein